MKMLVANNESEKKEDAACVKKDEENKDDKVLKLLTGIDVCKICAVRIISGNDAAVAQVYGKYKIDESEVKRGSHCFLCLGILEEFTLCAVAKNIAEQMEHWKYDSPTFQLGVAVPQCLILRQSSMITYLAENGNVSINRNFPSIKTISKFFLIKLIEKFAEKKMDNHSDLFIKLDYIFPDGAIEISKLDSLLEPERKRKLTESPSKKSVDYPYRAETITRVVKGLQDSDVKKYTIYPPKPLAETCEFAVKMHHTSLFLGGRYNKYSRTLLTRGKNGDVLERIGSKSGAVLERIGEKLMEFTQAKFVKFPLGEKEDRDIRILGKGQPFAVEIIDPKVGVITEEQLAKLQADINSTDVLAVHDLQKVNRGGFELMKKGKVITYRAKLCCPEQISDESIKKLNEMKDIELQQNTPVRALHRKYPIATLVKKVLEVELKRTDEDEHYELNATVQAGTYMKEFVHGDLGRTEPSLRSILGVPIDIVELDFISIDLNWPPELDDGDQSNDGKSKDDKS